MTLAPPWVHLVLICVMTGGYVAIAALGAIGLGMDGAWVWTLFLASALLAIGAVYLLVNSDTPDAPAWYPRTWKQGLKFVWPGAIVGALIQWSTKDWKPARR